MTDELMTAFATLAESSLALVKAMQAVAVDVSPRLGTAYINRFLIKDVLEEHENKLRRGIDVINRHR